MTFAGRLRVEMRNARIQGKQAMTDAEIIAHLRSENSRLLAALKDYVNHLLVERPISGLMAGKLTLWFLPGGDPSAEPSATQHPRYALSVERNSLDSASLGAIEAYQKAARAALTGAPDER